MGADGPRSLTPTALQQELVAAGHLGRKSGQGVYRYAADGTAVGVERTSPPRRLLSGPIETNPVARTLAMLVNEAVDLVHREATAEDVDTAMTLGTNYPKGPIAWGREIGYAWWRTKPRPRPRVSRQALRPSPALREGNH